MASRRHRELAELAQCDDDLAGLVNVELMLDPDISRFQEQIDEQNRITSDAERFLPSATEPQPDNDTLMQLAEEAGF